MKTNHSDVAEIPDTSKTKQIGEDWVQVASGFMHFHGAVLEVKDSRGILVSYVELLREKVYYEDELTCSPPSPEE